VFSDRQTPLTQHAPAPITVQPAFELQVHRLFTQICPLLHLTPQAPQLPGSLLSGVQPTPGQQVALPPHEAPTARHFPFPQQPPGQAASVVQKHSPPWQICPVRHFFPQAPQLF